MKTFHQIVAAVDFTPCCRAALREAVRRASLDGANVTAVHVMEEHLVLDLKAALSADEATVRQEWEKRLRAFVAEECGEASHVRVEVRVGHPFLELVQACATHEADLLVMGAKGSKDEPGRIGAIAAKCVRKAPVDVLIVRKSVNGHFKNAAKAVQFAFHVAAQDKAEVDCLHVYQSATSMALDYGGLATPLPPLVTDEMVKKNWQQELDTFLAPLSRKAEGLNVSHLIEEGPSVRDSLVDHIEKVNADLVVLGTRGKSGLRELLIGTTAEKIVQYAPCSILAVKPDDFVAAGS